MEALVIHPHHAAWNENLSAVPTDCYSIWVHPNQQIFHDVPFQNYGKPSQRNSICQELSGSSSHSVGLWTIWSVQSKEKPFKSTWDSMALYSVDFFWMLVFSIGYLPYFKGKLWNLKWWCSNVCEDALCFFMHIVIGHVQVLKNISFTEDKLFPYKISHYSFSSVNSSQILSASSLTQMHVRAHTIQMAI